MDSLSVSPSSSAFSRPSSFFSVVVRVRGWHTLGPFRTVLPTSSSQDSNSPANCLTRRIKDEDLDVAMLGRRVTSQGRKWRREQERLHGWICISRQGVREMSRSGTVNYELKRHVARPRLTGSPRVTFVLPYTFLRMRVSFLFVSSTVCRTLDYVIFFFVFPLLVDQNK